jgi:carboxymethylenebutenolidase
VSGPVRVLTQTVQIPVPDAPPMGGYLARPATDGTPPGVIVGMELFGISAHVRDVCDRLAGLGYLALAPDLYHRSTSGIELPEDEHGRTRGFELLHQLTRPQAIADIRAAANDLHARGSRIAGMVGLSVGGHIAYLAATALDLPAVAIAYGGWIPTTDITLSRPEPTLAATAGITGQVLFLVGDQDQLIPPEHREQLIRALAGAGVAHELVEYPGAGHGFLSDRRDSFAASAAADAWQRIQRLLMTAGAAV